MDFATTHMDDGSGFQLLQKKSMAKRSEHSQGADSVPKDMPQIVTFKDGRDEYWRRVCDPEVKTVESQAGITVKVVTAWLVAEGRYCMPEDETKVLGADTNLEECAGEVLSERDCAASKMVYSDDGKCRCATGLCEEYSDATSGAGFSVYNAMQAKLVETDSKCENEKRCLKMVASATSWRHVRQPR